MDFYLDIVSVEKRIFSGLVDRIQVSGSEGEMGIYPGHTQLLSIIKPGVIYIFHKNKTEECLYISGGILEVQPSVVSILADVAIRGIDLDRKRVVKAKKQAEEYFKKETTNVKKDDVLLEISKAIAKLRVLEIMDKFKK
ncbi:F0F1 ATP synthase subunit epsilon [Buchnera aphidicola (Schizaphis graminum)]|jgi:F-type H+-transporting ATPase subunit epsilon|uniref:ATP synthase epsilon chain n=2 Tax=Buchnera aphidicola TaxID=9 RepID=ATPE_BUCAP|nr:RecName: Full=ATP synthase epsilon chain; AltName: Full=ATP synthase F1 sector epsilon subunit; AltName: Full=F-ATPase epsilon subunit [Buchnera aphidicola str. Sg (Schizaphis graminum)]AAC38109.1 ATP synthase subunit epsilon [Buchnera aphidicola]AAM67581.1 ATP synthase epsilon chain [Buchnera aphidicola str. Sg (Schizaphis graminum)]AWI49916.1 F0F1 ATP synthase subunit epsilon [Buchnera aphidicola (Schizaphis graminum)]